jgi:hypothetical protein
LAIEKFILVHVYTQNKTKKDFLASDIWGVLDFRGIINQILTGPHLVDIQKYFPWDGYISGYTHHDQSMFDIYSGFETYFGSYTQKEYLAQ